MDRASVLRVTFEVKCTFHVWSGFRRDACAIGGVTLSSPMPSSKPCAPSFTVGRKACIVVGRGSQLISDHGFFISSREGEGEREKATKIDGMRQERTTRQKACVLKGLRAIHGPEREKESASPCIAHPPPRTFSHLYLCVLCDIRQEDMQCVACLKRGGMRRMDSWVSLFFSFAFSDGLRGKKAVVGAGGERGEKQNIPPTFGLFIFRGL